MRRTLLIIFIGACVADALSAADRYVAASGDNANSGTLAQPWRTMTHAVAASAG